MNKFIQHIPGFADDFEPQSFEFETTEELFNNTIVNNYVDEELNRTIFMEAESDRRGYDKTIMIRNEAYDWWWVIGDVKLDPNTTICLEQFDPPPSNETIKPLQTKAPKELDEETNKSYVDIIKESLKK